MHWKHFLWCAILISYSVQAQELILHSPNHETSIKIQLTDRIYYSVQHRDETLLWSSPLSMTLADEKVLGDQPQLKDSLRRSTNQQLATVWGIRDTIHDQFEELELVFRDNYSLIFRAYDDGVAYRWRTRLAGEITIKQEEVMYRFLDNHRTWAHEVGGFHSSFEKRYTEHPIDQMQADSFASLPMVLEKGAMKMAITEADLYDYPGLYLYRTDNNNRYDLAGLHPPYPLTDAPGGWCQFGRVVSSTTDYIARTNGSRDFPWRVLIIADTDAELADNDLVYKLSRPSKIANTDWIKPGRVAWDWWNDWQLSGVPFEAGINNKTYEYYIDFASRNKLEYIILDEGWSDQFDLFLERPEIDVPALVEYAEKKNVRLILWCVARTLLDRMDDALDQFAEWGIAGVKVDFIDRDDQVAVEWYEQIAAAAAQRQLLVDFHGCSKPTGLHRTYPNVVNFEGVLGNEYNKFSTLVTPEHNVTLAYTRMIAGPMDYTPGGMTNVTPKDFNVSFSHPRTRGTRCHQLGMYVVYYSPLQMLCDAPTQYEQYPDILRFLSRVPTVWDDTRVLAGQFGEYIVIARRKGDHWYLGALNNGTPRQISVSLDFLEPGWYSSEFFVDGANANRQPMDYARREIGVQPGGQLILDLKAGGGAAGWIYN